MSTWLRKVLAREPGFEGELVGRYTQRLLALARSQLPGTVRGRVDPEDVLQSVYRSFFQRLAAGEFAFDEPHDLWRLLAAITYRKTRNAATHHHRDRRDARRELPLEPADGNEPGATPDDLAALNDCLEHLLAGLPDQHREVVLARLRGESVEEIAARVRRSRRTVLRILAWVEDRAAHELEPPP
jgi:RNA polymerase sigma-70 factor (ECF subfamily)